MKTSLIVVLALAALGTAVTLSVVRPSAAVGGARAGFVTTPPAAPAGQMVMYGHVKTLKRQGGRYLMRFDPAWFTSGLTASRAKLEDTGSSDVPNDNYVIEEGHRLLTYVVSPRAHVTVLTNDGSGISSVPIGIYELSRIVNGGRHRKLFEPLESGVWIRVRIDRVLELDQQYQP